MTHDYDIIVVGGSANGLQSARTTAIAGMRVAVIEEHPQVGMPEHCSGLFSYWGLEKLDSMPPANAIFNDAIYGSRLIAPNGKQLTVRKTAPHAIVSDRAAFDRFLLQKAQAAGAEILQPYRVVAVSHSKVGVTVTATHGNEKLQLSADVLISAEGKRGRIAQQMGLLPPPADKLVYAAQFFMENMEDIDPTLVEVYQNHTFAPNYFGWIVPMSATSAKVGLGSSNRYASKQLERMLQQHPVLHRRTQHAQIIRRIAGTIPTTGPVKRTYADRFLLVGDVAGQTKPTTGGGVIVGGIAAQLAGKVAAEQILSGDVSAKALHRYEKLWKKELHWNLWYQRKVRNYIDFLSDAQMNRFFDILKRKGILAMVENHGHVDNQGDLAKKLLITPALYPFFLSTLGQFTKAILRS